MLRRKDIVSNVVILILFNFLHIYADYSQYQVKAAFIYNFPNYVEWPLSKLAEDDSLFTITIVGSSEVFKYLSDIAKTERIKGRKIVINRIDDLDRNIPDSEIVFLSSPHHLFYKKILENIDLKTTLVVGESEECIDKGPLICFYETGGRIRFQVNYMKIKESMLRVSSHLVQLGKRKSDL